MDEYIKKETAYRAIMGERPEAREPCWFAELVLEIPAVDAVEVVRCKDCIYFHKTIGFGFGMCSKTRLFPYDDDFCSQGERITDV